MHRASLILTLLIFVNSLVDADERLVTADATTRRPLSGATAFDRNGNVVGISNTKGQFPYISPSSFPLTFRYLGYKETTLQRPGTADTVFLSESFRILPEVFVESKQRKMLHLLGYVREYSTLSTYTDTVFLFREKMVDFMLRPDPKMKYRGWKTPRVLKADSYYRFINNLGLDSVSNKCNNHFSWSDWIGIITPPAIAAGIRHTESAVDTVMGRYSPTEIWTRNTDKVNIDIDILADTLSRKWVPNLSAFFHKNLDFEKFNLHLNYCDIINDSLSAADLAGYSFNIESRGRGIDMFRFNRHNEPFFVSTYAEVYIIDKEYISVKEARKWENGTLNTSAVEIIRPADAPALQPSVQQLIARINDLDHNKIRLDFTPDHRLVATHISKPQNIGQRALALLKQLTGITYIKSHRKFNRNWNEFRRRQSARNKQHAAEE